MTQSNFKEKIKAGLNGDYEGLSNGLERINTHIHNIQRGTYTLLGGLSGASKTTLLDYMLFNAIEDAESKNIPLNIIYYSWEIDEASKKANWLSMLIYKKYKMTIPPEKIRGYGKNRLTDEEQLLVFSEVDELERLFKKITWVWEPMTPTGCYKQWWAWMEKRGSMHYEPYIDDDNREQKRIVGFELDNPEEYNLVAIDHQSLAKIQQGLTLKQNIDKLSEYAVLCRNRFNMTFIFLSQFNQGLNSVERSKFKGVDISPQQSDFKDTTTPYSDADIVLGLMNAYKMDMETCLGYNINRKGVEYNLKHSFRMLKVVKNRLGRDNIAIGLLFLPRSGTFKELPEIKYMTKEWLDENLDD